MFDAELAGVAVIWLSKGVPAAARMSSRQASPKEEFMTTTDITDSRLSSSAGYETRPSNFARSMKETKNGFMTSEFYVTVAFVAGALIAAYADSSDDLGRKDGWMFASFGVAAYVVSRGLAKLATPHMRDNDDENSGSRR